MPKKCKIVCRSFRNGHPLTDEDRIEIAKNYMNHRSPYENIEEYTLYLNGVPVYNSKTGRL